MTIHPAGLPEPTPDNRSGRRCRSAGGAAASRREGRPHEDGHCAAPCATRSPAHLRSAAVPRRGLQVPRSHASDRQQLAGSARSPYLRCTRGSLWQRDFRVSLPVPVQSSFKREERASERRAAGWGCRLSSAAREGFGGAVPGPIPALSRPPPHPAGVAPLCLPAAPLAPGHRPPPLPVARAHPLLKAAAGGGGGRSRAVPQLRRLSRPQQAPREAPRSLAGHGRRHPALLPPLPARAEAPSGSGTGVPRSLPSPPPRSPARGALPPSAAGRPPPALPGPCAPRERPRTAPGSGEGRRRLPEPQPR